jgi:glycosyltransferase involved in cell wall biosynthesis
LNQLDSILPTSVDFAFVGSILKQSRFHIERERILSELVRHTDLQIWSEIKSPSLKQQRNGFVRRKASQAVAAAKTAGVPQDLINALPLVRRLTNGKPSQIAEQDIDAQIARRTRPPVFGVKMFQTLRRSRVVLNTHIDVSPSNASNMRLFEATGVGTCLLTDWKENLAELFEPDKEVLTYSSAAECVEKIRYILAREDERRAIAAAGQRRTLREHNFDNRAARIDEIIKEYFAAHR